ncbi:hypothetical protein [Streptomyces violaceusniger]|uniref:hypothetical protein n=1 Tax=Streptomyces violaceusniger TaxID=68280 RepID=UPI0038192E2E
MHTDDDSQELELLGPANDGFYTSNLGDWVPLCPHLKDSAVRFYWILRSLVIEKYGPVRKLTINELRYLLPAKEHEPGEPFKPSSLSRVRGLLDDLSGVGLISTPEGQPIKTSSRAKAAAGKLRIRINDRPRPGYDGPRNAFARLDAIKAPAAKAAEAAIRKEREREAARKAEKAAEAATQVTGQISDPEGSAGQISDPLGQKVDPLGQKVGPHSSAGLQDREPPLSPPAQSPHSDADDLNAVGHSAGGFASAGASEGAADETEGGRDGGSAASGTIPPQQQQQQRKSPRPATVATRERQMPPGAEAVIAAIPPEVCRPGSTPWVGLRRAVADLLTGNPAKGIPGRTPSQVIARMNRCWYDGRGPERSAPGYTPATPHRGDQPIRNPSSWLAAAILDQECPDPKCEEGTLITTGTPCLECAERRHEMAVAAQEAAAARAQYAFEEAALREFEAEAQANLWREILDDAHAEHERRERAAAERAEAQQRELAERERLYADIAAEVPELTHYRQTAP